MAWQFDAFDCSFAMMPAVHVPHLLAEIKGAASAPYLCLGPMAYSGYNPQNFRMCGWSWQRRSMHSLSTWKARRCAARNMSRPFPFPLGAMQLLSSPLAAAVGTSAHVAAFSIAANASANLRARESNEDVALGYWISRLSTEQRFNVSCALYMCTGRALCA